MVTQPDWNERASRYLRAELKRQGVTYDDLATRLNATGLQETKASISNKISRGAFTAAFFLAALTVSGVTVVRVDEI